MPLLSNSHDRQPDTRRPARNIDAMVPAPEAPAAAAPVDAHGRVEARAVREVAAHDLRLDVLDPAQPVDHVVVARAVVHAVVAVAQVVRLAHAVDVVDARVVPRAARVARAAPLAVDRELDARGHVQALEGGFVGGMRGGRWQCFDVRYAQ